MELFFAFTATVISDSRDIVRKRIQPYIYDMFRIKVYRNSPFKRSPGHTQILQPRKEEVIHHLIFTRHRLDKLRMGIDMFNQPVCIFAHFKEISFFFCRLYFPAAVRTFTIYKLRLRKERLTRSTVHSFIISLINIPLLIQLLKDFLYFLLMVIICRTDEFIIRSVHHIPDILNTARHIIHKFFRRCSCFFCL